jgi:secreted PhoX family phosphatase
MPNPIDRRVFLKRSGATGLFLAPSLSGLTAFGTRSGTPVVDTPAGPLGYGDLVESAECPGVMLPPGFHCKKVSEAGWAMNDGRPTPNAFDGMAAFPVSGTTIRLVRNHELRQRPPEGMVLSDEWAYDGLASGGCTTVELTVQPDGSVDKVGEWASLAGTLVNCAGGPTPWGSWLSCEETVAAKTNSDGEPTGWQQNHGYVFEVPAGSDSVVDPVPLRDMGRFVHEAVAVDPQTGILYLTEDQNPSGFFRFIPNQPGNLQAGGQLQMLGIIGRRNYDSRTRQTPGERLPATWIDINDPDPSSDFIRPDAVFQQGFARGGANFARLEGCCAGEGFIYFDATSGGNAGAGQIWQYLPEDRGGGELVLVFESPSPDVLKQPDNICMSPRGGLAICEDAGGDNHLRGIDGTGNLFDFLRNDMNTMEWAGACFSPQGRTMFVNLQGALWQRDDDDPKGMTFAIWGPWEEGGF